MSFVLSFRLGEKVKLSKNEHEKTHDREVVLARLNDFSESLKDKQTGELAFLGLTEGVLLAEEAHERGYETESWVLDEGLAPHERDWLSQEKNLNITAYFSDEGCANQAKQFLESEYALEESPKVSFQEEQDWNATWKASFQGIDVTENLKVLPPWSDDLDERKKKGNLKGIMVINPGAGFGTGTHETTQLCLKLLLDLGDLSNKVVLDFGSGSGILGIACAMFGAKEVYCVEIDPLANDNARENAELNGVSDRIQFLDQIPESLKTGKVDILVANILRPILLRFAPTLKSCLNEKASELVLSGLIESDLPPVIQTYEEGATLKLQAREEKNEWRALWLRRGTELKK